MVDMGRLNRRLTRALTATKDTVTTGRVISVDRLGRTAMVRLGGAPSGARFIIPTQTLADTLYNRVQAGDTPSVTLRGEQIDAYETGLPTATLTTTITVEGVNVLLLSSDFYSHIADPDAHHTAFTGLMDDTATVISPDSADRISIFGGAGMEVVGNVGTNSLSVNAKVGDGMQVVSDALAVNSTVVRTTRQFTAGDGLTGGGTFAADRTFEVNQAFSFIFSGVPTFNPTTLGAPPFVIGANAADVLVPNLVAEQVQRNVYAGAGLVDSGNSLLTADVTLGVAEGHGVVVSADAVAVDEEANFEWLGFHSFLADMQAADILPLTTGTHTLGSSGLRWLGVYGNTFDFSGAGVVSGDFTVGANVLRVDPVGQRVGINRVADAQFALDVLGNTRTSGYFVGKHAIQLEGALLVSHFDGKAPFATDFTGSPIGHRGQQPTASGGVIYRPGRFDKAVQLAEATTNLWGNPVFSSATTGITFSQTGSGGSLTRITTQAYVGVACGEVVTGTGFASLLYDVAVTSGLSYTISCYVKRAAGGAVTVADLTNVAVGGASSTSFTISVAERGWYRVWGVCVAAATGTLATGIVFEPNRTLYVDGLQVEQKAYPTPLAVGDMGSGHDWVGTAHASSTTRTVTVLRYDPGPLFATSDRTIGVWFRVPTTTGDKTIFDIRGAGGVVWSAAVASDNSLSVTYGTSTASAAASVAPSIWHLLVCVVAEAVHTVYLDGALLLTHTTTSQFPLTTTFDLGASSTGTNVLNGALDDLFVLEVAASADLVRTIYESGAPVFAETANWSFQTPNTLAWADEYGLWAINDQGAAAFGVSGVNGRSWGGQTLDKGDVLLGNGTSFTKWDASAGLLAVAGDLTAQSGTFSGVMTVGAAGGIYAGSGSFATPTTGAGLKLYMSSGIGSLEGWSAGVVQTKINTAGEVEWAAGSGKLNATGQYFTLLSGKNSRTAINWVDGGNTVFRIGAGTFVGDHHAFIDSPGSLAVLDIELATTFSEATSFNGLVYANTGLQLGSPFSFGASSFPGSPSTNQHAYHTVYRAWFSYDGAAWKQVSVGAFNGAMPASPVDDLRVYRTDKNMEFFYHSASSQWLSVHEYAANVAEFVFTATGTAPMSPVRHSDFAIQPTHIKGSFKVDTTHDATNRWTLTFRGYDATRTTATNLVGDQNSWSWNATVATWGAFEFDTSTVAPANRHNLMFGATKVAAPGNMTGSCTFYYRLIG